MRKVPTNVVMVLFRMVWGMGDLIEVSTDNIVLQNTPLIIYMVVVTVFEKLYNRVGEWLTKLEGHLVHAEITIPY